MVALEPSNTSNVFRVYEELVHANSVPIWFAFQWQWKQGNAAHYKFDDCTEGMLTCFIYWMLTGIYDEADGRETRTMSMTSKSSAAHYNHRTAQHDQPQPLESYDSFYGMRCSSSASSASRTSLLFHINMVVFADTYLIEDLKMPAMFTIKKTLAEKYRKSIPRDEIIEVWNMVKCAFENLLEDDGFLVWLGQYVAYRIEDFSAVDEEFHSFLTGNYAFGKELIKNIIATVNDPFIGGVNHEEYSTGVHDG